MGVFDNWLNRKQRSTAQTAPALTKAADVTVAAKDDEAVSVTFNNKNFTYNGELAGLDYTAILRDKQSYNNIQSLFS